MTIVPIWVKVIAAVLAVAAIAYGVHLVLEHFREEGRAEIRPQLVASQKAEKDREAENAACVAASKIQSQAVKDAEKQATDAKALTAAIIAKAQAAARLNADKIKSLQDFAGAKPKVQTCEQTLSAADKIARDAARERRK